eukprot:TRINITY_DN5524_c0_g1_i1.p1 TRINITY_DN5524_c0_g1~~TRINITY_DN5524_c0_g1_i1.p1  ORF type:complete len:718 (+),score=153.78 TRINITY_DN5524_c0_g1_i1:278-2155(+)
MKVGTDLASASADVSGSRRAVAWRRRLPLGLACASLAGGTALWWQVRRRKEAAEAPAATAYVLGSRKALERLKPKPSWRRLLHLLAMLSPLALLWPLQWLCPSFFWTVVAEQLDRCGPCFVKLAQWCATRRDIFSSEFCDALSSLHEEVRASWSSGSCPKAVADRLREDGVNVAKLEEKATSSGSIAEVFFGELGDGTEVAVKCLRPGIQPLLESDLAWLLWLGQWAERTATFRHCGLKRAMEDFSEQLLMQVNFEIEAAHLKLFKSNFSGAQRQSVCFPTLLYSSPDVLVLSRERGRNLAHVFSDASAEAVRESASPAVAAAGTATAATSSALPLRRGEAMTAEERGQQERARALQRSLGISEELARCIAFESMCFFMRMILQDGFIHGDLHPGNVLLKLPTPATATSHGVDGASAAPGAVSGGLVDRMRGLWNWAAGTTPSPYEFVLIDTGLAIPLRRCKIDALRKMAIAILYADYDRAAKVIYNESPDTSECTHPEEFIAELGAIFRATRQDVIGKGFLQLSDACLGALKLVNKHKVGIDTELQWVLLSMLSIEGAARQFDPMVDATAAASRYLVTIPNMLEELSDGASRESLKQMVLQMVLESFNYDYWEYRNNGVFVQMA